MLAAIMFITTLFGNGAHLGDKVVFALAIDAIIIAVIGTWSNLTEKDNDKADVMIETTINE